MHEEKVASIGSLQPSVPDVGRPVIVGEVLFDVFPDGLRVLGGAPFNVAWHLQAFGFEPLVVTRIGGDTLGDEVLRAMEGWGMDVTGVQVDAGATTGRVRVELDHSAPTFEILDDQAYDRLDATAAMAAATEARPALLYHGSLIARSEIGRGVLGELRVTGAPVFVDINLRDPWWRPSDVGELITGARWLKVNDDELAKLIPEPAGADGMKGPELAAAELARRNGIEQVIVTCGDRGAFVVVEGRSTAGRPPVAVEVVDTVGAGDAFSAIWIAGVLRRWRPETTLIRALGFAGAVCGFRGATTSDRRVYERQLTAWEQE
jgi:fructokinase